MGGRARGCTGGEPQTARDVESKDALRKSMSE